MKITFPFKNGDKYPITQKFGATFYYQGKERSHNGVDFGLPNLTPLFCPFDRAKISRIERDRITGYGKTIYLKSEQKEGEVEIWLAHLDKIEDLSVGCRMVVGQQIGLSGRSGFWRGVNGYHLHLGMRINKLDSNPLPFLFKCNPDQLGLFEKAGDSALKSFHENYKVIKGDTLWDISKKYYGTGTHYMEIFYVNNDILKNPHEIFPGQVLRIPALKNAGI